jgi:hypothetical protein
MRLAGVRSRKDLVDLVYAVMRQQAVASLMATDGEMLIRKETGRRVSHEMSS